MLRLIDIKVLKLMGKWVQREKRKPERSFFESDTAKKQVRKLKIIEDDPNLSAFESDLNERVRHFKQRKKELLAPGQTLTEFASGHLYYGFHKVKGGWVYREWAPGATAMHLIGDFNNWNRTSHPMKAVGNGNWGNRDPRRAHAQAPRQGEGRRH